MRDNRNRNNGDFYPAERNRQITNSTSPAIFELTKKEQDHRHQWQDKYLASHNSSFRLGQICGFFYNLALLYVVYDLIQNDEKFLALQIFALNAALIAFAIIVTAIERKILSKKPQKRMHNNHFRNRDNRTTDQHRRRDDGRRF